MNLTSRVYSRYSGRRSDMKPPKQSELACAFPGKDTHAHPDSTRVVSILHGTFRRGWPSRFCARERAATGSRALPLPSRPAPAHCQPAQAGFVSCSARPRSPRGFDARPFGPAIPNMTWQSVRALAVGQRGVIRTAPGTAPGTVVTAGQPRVHRFPLVITVSAALRWE